MDTVNLLFGWNAEAFSGTKKLVVRNRVPCARANNLEDFIRVVHSIQNSWYVHGEIRTCFLCSKTGRWEQTWNDSKSYITVRGFRYKMLLWSLLIDEMTRTSLIFFEDVNSKMKKHSYTERFHILFDERHRYLVHLQIAFIKVISQSVYQYI